MVIACLILDRNHNSPRTGQFSRMQTKLREHIKISLRTISIKFLLVIKMLYKTKNGRQQVSNTVPAALYRMYGNSRTWCIISIVTENKPHAHHETHLHTMKVVTILIPNFYGHCKERLGLQLSFCVLNMKKIKQLADYEPRCLLKRD